MNDLLSPSRHIRTFTGLSMNVFEPTPEMICIEDIAHHLSMHCRFGGATPEFYSVAQHSYLCSTIVKRRYKLAALLHDASEAYLQDIQRPVKVELTNYFEIEDALMKVIAEKFGFAWPLERPVQEADEKMLLFEWEFIVNKSAFKSPFECFPHWKAEQLFLKTFNELM